MFLKYSIQSDLYYFEIQLESLKCLPFIYSFCLSVYLLFIFVVELRTIINSSGSWHILSVHIFVLLMITYRTHSSYQFLCNGVNSKLNSLYLILEIKMLTYCVSKVKSCYGVDSGCFFFQNREWCLLSHL